MSGFDLSELLPFYLDETDEHIAALNDALLRLEQDPPTPRPWRKRSGCSTASRAHQWSWGSSPSIA